jgi:lipopolysaccharide export LptBFGC system permease protein LptF
MVIGTWYAAVYLSFWLSVALIPINNRLIYEGDIGTLLMHLWFALPLAVMAATAIVVLLAVSDVRRKEFLIAGLTCLFLYSGFTRRAGGAADTATTIDRVGTFVGRITPATVCLLVGLYKRRRSNQLGPS